MKRFMNRRSLALFGVLLASQLLSACVIVPRPYYHRYITEVDVQPGYNAPSHGENRDRRHWNRR